jgi:oxygen-independent coproporphyrinogen-3 oxidase
VKITDAQVDRVARALADAPSAAYTTPHVYPWAVQNFEPRPLAERVRPGNGSLRLYVHIPFCNYRCTFCFFAVRVGAKRAEMERYVAALERELAWVTPGTSLAQLFIGGGTPTALPPDLLSVLLHAVLARMTSAAGRPHTVEASPESIRDGHLRVLQDHAVGRVSMGIESLDDSVLDTVRRRHTPVQALEACRLVVASGRLLNIDLIYGLPGQTEASFQRDLEAVAAAGVHSLCLYVLRTNENTPVAARLAAEERLDLGRLMRWRAFVTRAAAELGFEQTRCFMFERRAATRPEPSPTSGVGGAIDQFGIGMSARSQLGDVVYRNHERSEAYLQRVERSQSPVETVFHLDLDDRKAQLLAGSLGGGKALWRTAYENAIGSAIDDDFGELLERLRAADLIEDDGSWIVLTETGKLVYDRVLLCFYPERAKRWLREREGRPSDYRSRPARRTDLAGLADRHG